MPTSRQLSESTAGGAGEGTETPLSLDITIGDSELVDVSPVQGEAGTWLVQVPANASFLTEGSHDIVVEWRRGEKLVASETTTIIVDLTAPAISYTAPTSLTVGTAVSILPSATDEDIASYALKTGSSLLSGLSLNGTSGVVSGTLLRVVRPRSRVAFTPAAQIGIGPDGTEDVARGLYEQLPRLGIATPAGAAPRGHVPPPCNVSTRSCATARGMRGGGTGSAVAASGATVAA